MSVETVLETIVVSEVLREAGAPETVVEQLVRTEVVVETSGRPGKPGASVVDVVAVQADDGTVTLTFTMSDGETHVVTFQAGTGGVVEPPAAVTLAGAGTARAEALAVLRAALDLSGAATGFSAVTATASLSSWIALAASAEARAAAAGTLAASLPLAGSGTGRGMVSGEPAFRIDLAAAGEGRSAASASLAATLGLAGSATARGTAAAQVALALQCAGAAVARAQASGFLTLGNDLALQASVTARATASGMFALDVSIAGTAAGRALASGTLTAARDVAGAATARAMAAGSVLAARALAGSATGAGTATGTVTLQAGSSYDPDAQTAFNAMTVQPSSARATLLSDLIAGLKADGVWAKLIGYQLYAAHDDQAGRVDLKDPSRIASKINLPAFTVDRGFQGDSSTAATLDTRIIDNPANQDNVSFGGYVNNLGQDTAPALCWWGANSNRIIAGGTARARTNTDASFAAVGALGLFAVNRGSAAQFEAYHNGVLAQNRSSTSLTPNTGTSLITHRQSTGTTNGNRIAFMFAGLSMTADEHAKLHSRTAAFLTAIGAN